MPRSPAPVPVLTVLAMIATLGCGDAAKKRDGERHDTPNGKADGESRAHADTTAAAPTAASQCPADYEAELARVLVAGCDTMRLDDFTPIDVLELARASWETTPRDRIDGVSVVLTPEGLQKQGTVEPWNAAAAQADLRERIALRRERDPSWAPRFVAVIHADVKLAAVQALLATLAEASLTSGTLVLASGTLPPTPAPLHPEVYTRLAADLDPDPSMRASKLAQGLEDDIVGCPALANAFMDAAKQEPTQRCETMMPAAAKAIVGCSCPAWTPTVVTRLQLISDRTAVPQLHVEDIEIAKDRPTKVDGTQTWAAFLAGRSAPLGALWLETAPITAGTTTWIVAGEAGVQEIDLDGKVLRLVADIPSRSPRWLPGRTSLVFLAKDPKRETFTDLRVMDVATGTHRTLAQLPDAPPCPAADYTKSGDVAPELSLTNEDELWLAKDGKHVCAVLANHEADLRDVERAISVAIVDGKVVDRAHGGAELCGKADEDAPSECADGGWSTYEGESPFSNHSIATAAPGGGWLVVIVASELGDVLHNQYVLYEVATKKLYPLPRGKSQAWPKPARLDLAKHDGTTFVEGLGDFGGSEAIGWIGDKHLFIGRTLFVAGERIVELVGDPAR